MRFRRRWIAPIGLLAMAVGGCASGAGTGSGTGSLATDAGSGKIGPALLQWSGKFHAVQQASATFSGMQVRNRASGTVVLTAPTPSITHVELDLSIYLTDAVRLPWALSSGACGANSIPVVAVSEFPQISTSNGHGSLSADVSVEMPVSGTYHVNIFDPNSQGQDQSTVITCADLTLGRRGS